MPILTIFQHPVLTELAAAVDQGQLRSKEGSAAQHFYTLFPIQTSGTRPPFFWFHSQLISFLPDYLGLAQPVYAFIAQGVDGRRARYKTTRDITAHYLRELRTVQPTGPYFLGGFCWGAQIAFAIAQHLLQQGEDVALLFLVEPLLSSANPKQKIAKKLSRWLNHHRQELVRLPVSGKILYVIKTLLNELNIYRYISEAYLCMGRPLPISLRINYALDIIHRASRDFVQKPYPKEIMVIQAEKGIHPADTDWSNLSTDRITVRVVPAAVHMDLLQEPGTGVWAKWLNTDLSNAQSSHSGPDE